mmetsp:Transcript_5569/g.15566  ORF Transcript_5569/g.15566 Transcript_5569/m.15566 type:complete len:140 (-) Transcript_5569:115-534(-)|eukprot:CAMPEP_0118881630 /NCGR_PEP_ID=MMETSP1163-20130328/21057_1 /TAXON_ID=124430 /ORGANISM="Phaeomonas parva, Strain CCMP2877" /LENGTH=139 /DNA_ID=CAMNT_0006818449 /DNA_START=140 /DNA_END=559 /DNA_ORIENTATION=-
MMELADERAGAEVVSASSYDTRHEPRCILDMSQATFWSSTGTFPQEVVVRIEPSLVSGVCVFAINVRSISLEYCDEAQPIKWTPVEESFDEVFGDDGSLQEIRWLDFPRVRASYIKVIINAGWQDYITIHGMSITGSRN